MIPPAKETAGLAPTRKPTKKAKGTLWDHWLVDQELSFKGHQVQVGISIL